MAKTTQLDIETLFADAYEGVLRTYGATRNGPDYLQLYSDGSCLAVYDNTYEDGHTEQTTFVLVPEEWINIKPIE